eukprot:Gb_15813 [translate_table: standard]
MGKMRERRGICHRGSPPCLHMKQLKVLNLSGCMRLAELPELKSLESLTRLYLGGGWELMAVLNLPKGLLHMNLAYCSELRRISTMLHMKKLQVLNLKCICRILKGCGEFEAVSDGFVVYDVDYNRTDLWRLPSWASLQMSNCCIY